MTRSVVDDVVVPMALAPAARCGCRPPRCRSPHHERLLAVESDPDAVLDLFDLAVTWAELDYSESDVLPPEAWVEFAAGHRWRRPERVARMFSLAADVALRGCVPTRHDADARWELSAQDILRGEL